MRKASKRLLIAFALTVILVLSVAGGVMAAGPYYGDCPNDGVCQNDGACTGCGDGLGDGTGQQTIDGKPVIKPFWKISESEVKQCLQATRWCPAELEYFRGGGFSTQFLTKGEMPVTMSRINLVRGLGPVLQIAEGHTVEIPQEAFLSVLDIK